MLTLEPDSLAASTVEGPLDTRQQVTNNLIDTVPVAIATTSPSKRFLFILCTEQNLATPSCKRPLQR